MVEPVRPTRRLGVRRAVTQTTRWDTIEFMRKHRSDLDMIEEALRAIADRQGLNGELLMAIAHAIGANEKRGSKFRTAVIQILSRIQTTAELIHAAQLAEIDTRKPIDLADLESRAKDSEKFIAQKSNELGLRVVRFIYSETGTASAPRHDKRRRWSNWEI